MNISLFLTLAMFWGFSFIAIRETILTFPPFMAAGIRIFLALVILLVFTFIKKRPNPIKGKLILHMFLLGIFLFGIPWGCLFWGEQYINPSLASIINSTVPIFILLFSWGILPDEQPTLPTTIGVILGFFGIVFIFSSGLRVGASSHELAGILSIFGMALSYAMGGVLMKKLSKGIDMVWALIFQAMSGTVCLFIISGLKGETIQNIEHLQSSSLGLIYLSVCSTVLASLIYYHLIFQWGALKAAAVTYLSPIVAIIVDRLVLNVQPRPNEYMGGVLIMMGLLLIHWARTRNIFSKKTV